jgi:hypothetical protein
MSRYERLIHQLFKPVDASSLVYFRVAFGVIMLWEVWDTWDRIPDYYIDPVFFFKYYGFEWVHPWPGNGMYWHFALLAVVSFLIAIGAFYRIATILFFFAFSYIFLLDQALHLNHFYFVILLSFLLMIVPANRAFAVDALLRPKLRSDTVPAWSILLFRLQYEVMLVYAGIVKVNPDWLRLEPLAMWLAGRDWPILGPLFNEDWVVALGAYGTIALHLVGAPLLFNRRVRAYIIVWYFGFHLMNFFLFNIGIFPWVSMAGTLLFLDPDWPRKVIRWVKQRARMALPLGKEEPRLKPIQQLQEAPPESQSHPKPRRSPAYERALVAFIAVWLVFQILVPLRHLLYPGSPSWTEEGHRFSWQMKLRDKEGVATYIIRYPATGQEWTVTPEEYLEPHQQGDAASRPDMILQFAHYLARAWAEEQGIEGVEVRAHVCVSLNGRKGALLIDPNVDLVKVERSLRHANWILPLEQPFERPARRKGPRQEDIRC